MNEQITDILNYQQEYEYLKHAATTDILLKPSVHSDFSPIDEHLLSSDLLPQVISTNRKQKFRYLYVKVMNVILTLLVLAFIVFLVIAIIVLAFC